jgi:hypothetical protein
VKATVAPPTGHTPGPWKRDEFDAPHARALIVGPGPCLVAWVNLIPPGDRDGVPFPGCGGDPAANVRLIEHAPALLQRLAELTAWAEGVLDALGDAVTRDASRDQLRAARAAVNAARGVQPVV